MAPTAWENSAIVPILNYSKIFAEKIKAKL
jgi:hypothetical protein